MPKTKITPDLEMYYEVDDFADPWREHETVLLMHGNAEIGAVWYGWMPHLTAKLKVVRPGDSYHVAATAPAECARATLEFITESSR